MHNYQGSGHPDPDQKVGRLGAEHVYSLTAGGLSSNPSRGSPNPIYTLSLHTPVIHQMLLPGSQCGFSAGNPAGPLSLVSILVHGGFQLGTRLQTTHQASNHTEFHAKTNYTYSKKARCPCSAHAGLPFHGGTEGPDELLSPESVSWT